MKHARLLLLFSLALGTGRGQAQSDLLALNANRPAHQPSPEEKGATRSLRDFLGELEARYGILFIYKTEELKDRRVQPTALRGGVERILRQTLQPAGLRFEKVNKTFIIRPIREDEPRPENRPAVGETPRTGGMLPFSVPETAPALGIHPSVRLLSADIVLQGRVTDEAGAGLPGVNVTVKGTPHGVTTDARGDFRLAVPDRNAVLVFSSVGYVKQEITVGERTALDVVLKADTQSLGEVVVVGYGTVRKSDLTGSVASVSAAEISKLPVASVNQALVGRAPGVRVVNESGAPGAGVTVRIRGVNSIQGNNDPLYVVDGFPLTAGVAGGGDNARNPLAGINPNDIESIEILKDASAVAIYGSRGANGVVLITTKQGKAGKVAIDFDAYVGTQSEINRYDVLTGREFAELYNEAVTNAGNPAGSPKYPQSFIDSVGQGTNWRNAVLRDAPIRNYQLSISGGNDKTRYLVSGNYFNQQGIIRNSGFDRMSAKLNLISNLTPKFAFGTNLTLSQSRFNGAFGNSANATFGGGYIDLYYSPPSFPIYNPNGSYYQINTLSAFPFPNPVENAEAITRDQVSLRLLGNVFGEYKILPELSLKVTLGADLLMDNISEYLPTYTQRSQLQGQGSRSNTLNRTWLNTNTLTYAKTLGGKHDLTLLLGHEVQVFSQDNFGGTSQRYTNNSTGYNSLQSGQLISALSSGYSNSALQSFFNRASYIYNNKYLATFTARLDGSSRFRGANQYSFFPSGALAWRISEEPFMKRLTVVSDLKARASYGITGSQAIAPYQTLDLVASNNTVTIDGNTTTLAFFPNQLANPALLWEQTQQFDAGLDVGLFKNRLNLTLDYFVKRTQDLLLNVDLPATTGFGTVLSNVGSLENRGVELGINSRNVVGKFTWTTALNLTTVRNNVLSLGKRQFLLTAPGLDRANPGDAGGARVGITQVGQPVGSFYVLLEDGIIDDAEELKTAPTYNGMVVGGRRYVDTNGDKVINANDRVIVGNSQPRFTGGITNDFSFAGFDLSVFLEGSYGNRIYNASRFLLERPNAAFNVTREFYENRWTGPGTSTTYPQVRANGLNYSVSDSYIEDGSYLRLKNVTLGYAIPARLLQRLGLGSARLYVNATNLLTFTRYKGIEPDINAFGGNTFGMGIDYSAYPTAKTFTAGIHLGL